MSWRSLAAALPLLTLAAACTPAPETASVDTATEEVQTGLVGPYLGQTPPGDEPALFAPGLVSTGMAERDFAMTPAGDEIYYTTVLGASFDFSAIVVTRLVDGIWTEPEVASFSGRHKDLEPALSPDGQKLFFVSYRPQEGDAGAEVDEDLWFTERTGEGWGEPRPVGAPVNTDSPEFFPSVARDGTLYFTRRGEDRAEAIYRSRWQDGAFQQPERLPAEVNAAPTQFNAFIDPEQRYLIVCSWGREDSLGGVDYYIVFRDQDDSWTGPVNLGEKINTSEGQEWSPYVTPDGKYFFFMSSRATIEAHLARRPMRFEDLHTLHSKPMNGNPDIWWVRADFLEDLRPVATEGS